MFRCSSTCSFVKNIATHVLGLTHFNDITFMTRKLGEDALHFKSGGEIPSEPGKQKEKLFAWVFYETAKQYIHALKGPYSVALSANWEKVHLIFSKHPLAWQASGFLGFSNCELPQTKNTTYIVINLSLNCMRQFHFCGGEDRNWFKILAVPNHKKWNSCIWNYFLTYLYLLEIVKLVDRVHSLFKFDSGTCVPPVWRRKALEDSDTGDESSHFATQSGHGFWLRRTHKT